VNYLRRLKERNHVRFRVYDLWRLHTRGGRLKFGVGGIRGYNVGFEHGACICMGRPDQENMFVLNDCAVVLMHIVPCQDSFFFGTYYKCDVVMEEFSWDAFRGNFAQLKRLLEGKEFSVDVKCRDPKVIRVNCPIICVSNEWFLGDEAFQRRFRIMLVGGENVIGGQGGTA
jgi:hypothetical protein